MDGRVSVQSLSAEIGRHLEVSGTYHEINAHAVSGAPGEIHQKSKNRSLRAAYHDILTPKKKKKKWVSQHFSFNDVDVVFFIVR